MPTPQDDLEHTQDPSKPITFEEMSDIADGTRCYFCYDTISREELDDPDAIYVQVSSWVTGAKLQSPKLRTQGSLRAHAGCVRKVVDGEAPDQEALEGL